MPALCLAIRSDRHILRAVDSEAQTAKEEEEEEEQGAAAAAEGEEGMWGIQPGVEEEWQWERSPDAGRAYAAWASLLLLGATASTSTSTRCPHVPPPLPHAPLHHRAHALCQLIPTC